MKAYQYNFLLFGIWLSPHVDMWAGVVVAVAWLGMGAYNAYKDK